MLTCRSSRILYVMLSCLVLLLSAGTRGAAAEERIALVIGNAAYVGIPALPNPANDAALMARTLRGLDFEVLEYKNLNQSGMRRALRDFSARLASTGPDSVALFYYAGHGLQVDGVNYLVPVTAVINRASDIPIESVRADQITRIMGQVPGRLNFLILDACRNNPFEGGRSVGGARGQGLARMDAPAGTMIAYSTAPDAVAMDGEGANSPYTGALADFMREPGLPVERMFRRVRNSVMEATDNAQVPWESSSLTGDDFYFAGPAPAVHSGEPSRPSPSLAPGAGDFIFWNTVRNSDDAADFRDYLSRFPKGVFVRQAERRLKELSAQTVASLAVPDLSDGQGVAWTADRLTPGTRFRDCADCPEMTVVPPGRFQMGASMEDPDRGPEEGPSRIIALTRAFALSRHEITRGEFAAFAAATGHRADGPCWTENEHGSQNWTERDWRDPGFTQTDRHPAVCLSWQDSLAYVNWLSTKTGVVYRLPTEAEWEYAARGGTDTPRYWTGGADAACTHANGADRTIGLRHADWTIADCSDGFALTAPAGSFEANGYGLQDMAGNVAEWVLDCWVERLDQLGMEPPGCTIRSLRGGAFLHDPASLRVSARLPLDQRLRSYITGLRVLREIR